MNYNATIKAKLDDPKTPREEYMRLWEQWQDILHRQAVCDAEAEQRRTKGQQS